MVTLLSRRQLRNITAKSKERPRRWRELFEIRVIMSKAPAEVGSKFLYHINGYQRKRWACGALNIKTKTVLLHEIRKWLDEVESEITGVDWEL